MPVLQDYKPKDERELHGIIKKEIDSLEQGLIILKHEFRSQSGRYDFLCVDKDRILTVIEVKVDEDKYHLHQALNYYVDVLKNKHRIALTYNKNKIDAEGKPRIILISKSYLEVIKEKVSLLNIKINLIEYTTHLTPQKEIGIIFKPIEIPVLDYTLPKEKKIKDHLNKLKNNKLRNIFDKIIKDIERLDTSVEVYSTTQSVVFKHMPSNRVIGFINTREKLIQVFAHIINNEGVKEDKYEEVYVEKGDEDLSTIFARLTENIKTFSSLKK